MFHRVHFPFARGADRRTARRRSRAAVGERAVLELAGRDVCHAPGDQPASLGVTMENGTRMLGNVELKAAVWRDVPIEGLAETLRFLAKSVDVGFRLAHGCLRRPNVFKYSH